MVITFTLDQGHQNVTTYSSCTFLVYASINVYHKYDDLDIYQEAVPDLGIS